ncbi:hypothetical protein SELMODRAFT_409882 [Selaginella moellendorffii]|uniref:Uncharacterized protein n=1 Tax=Selaginella moellendorffii TaxID=88036 RepID=D8RCS2_SELML|nr:hypothetical protein SELMODRAFT_409882 [Selaginella moellendorffii]
MSSSSPFLAPWIACGIRSSMLIQSRLWHRFLRFPSSSMPLVWMISEPGIFSVSKETSEESPSTPRCVLQVWNTSHRVERELQIPKLSLWIEFSNWKRPGYRWSEKLRSLKPRNCPWRRRTRAENLRSQQTTSPVAKRQLTEKNAEAEVESARQSLSSNGSTSGENGERFEGEMNLKENEKKHSVIGAQLEKLKIAGQYFQSEKLDSSSESGPGS